MKLTALLERLPPQLLELLPDRPSDPEVLSQAVRQMKPWALEVLKVALRRFGPLPFEGAALEAAALAEGYSGAHVKAAVAVLRRKGIVFGLRKSWGEELYLIPEDVLPVWHDLLFPGGLRQAETPVLDSGEAFGNAGTAAYDVLSLLDMIRNNQVKTTRQGTMPKPFLRKAEQALAVQDGDLCRAGMNFPAAEAFGPAVGAVLDMAIRTGLLLLREDMWIPHPSKLEAWLQKPLAEVQKDLYRRWIGAARAGEAWELHALARLEQGEHGRWYLLDHLFEWLRDCGMINRIHGRDLEHFVQARLIPMQAFGWVRLLRLPTEGTAFMLPISLCEPVEPEPGIYSGMVVQADLEIILPPSPPLELLWDLMSWCEPVSSGDLFIYRLTKESVRRGAERGITARHMADVLRKYSGFPVDERVLQTVKEWAESFRGTLQTGADLLRLEDSALQEAVEASAACRGCLSEKIADAVYIVLPGETERLARELEKLGAALFRSSSATPLTDLSDKEIKEPLPVTVPHLKDPVYAPSPMKEEWQEEWKSVPAVWWKEQGAYHPSTQKEIVRTAMDWKAPIRLTSGDGIGRDIIPTAIRESDGLWILEGLQGTERVAVKAGDWVGMKLILPGYSD